MKHRNLILSVIAGVAMSWAASVQAAPFLTLGLNVLDTANAPIAPSGANTWSILGGTTVRIQVTATITSPNSTDAGHTNGDGDPLGAIQLGIQNLTFNLLTGGGPSSILQPLDTGTGKWALTGATVASRQAIPTAINYASTNLIDQGADGDLDPSGAGYSQNTLLFDGSDTLGYQNGLNAPFNVTRGGYVLVNGGGVTLTNTLSTTVVAANFFFDPTTGGNNDLGAAAFALEDITNAAITINVLPVPEPASIGLLSLASLGLLGIRRRRA